MLAFTIIVTNLRVPERASEATRLVGALRKLITAKGPRDSVCPNKQFIREFIKLQKTGG